jgi:pimeloyl-ACP methyl ester carboxylesterase
MPPFAASHVELDRRHLLLGAAALASLVATEGYAMTSTTPGAYAEIDGLKVYYELHGAPLSSGRAPFLLLPGGMMAIETSFAGGLLPALARLGPVIAMEQQGHGHTADRPGPASLERLVQDAAGLLAHLRVEKAHRVGHSLGGMTAMGVAIGHPDRAASLTAIGTTYTLDGMQPELVKMQTDPTHQPSAEIMPLLPTEADFAAWKGHYDKFAPHPEAFEEVLAKLNVMLGTWKGWTKDQLGRIAAPTLVAIGDNDFVRIDHAAEMARLIPGAQLAVLPGTTHMNIIHRVDWLVPMVAERIA